MFRVAARRNAALDERKNSTTIKSEEDIRGAVRETYGRIADAGPAAGGCMFGPEHTSDVSTWSVRYRRRLLLGSY